MTTSRLIIFLFTLILSLFSPSILAYDTDLFDMNLRQLMNIPITGSTLTPQTVSTSPAAVTVFNADFISSLGVEYLHELLNYVPGLQTQRTADFNFSYSYSFRGRRNGGQSKEALMVLDGQILNDPRTGAANGAVRLMSVANIDRVEVIRGPNSALYGTGAFSGVINIISKKNDQYAALQVGHFNKTGITFKTSNTHQTFKWNTYLHAQKDGGDEYRVADTFSDNDILTHDPRSLIELHSHLDIYNTNISFYAQKTTGEDYYSLGLLSNGFNQGTYEYYGTLLNHKFNWHQNLTSNFEFEYRYNHSKIDAQLTESGALFAISNPQSNDPLFIKAKVRGQTYRSKLHNNLVMNDALSVQFGMDWQRNTELTSQAANNFNTDQLYAGVIPVEYFGNFDQITNAEEQEPRDAFGVYSQGIWQLSNQHQFNLGLRYDSDEAVASHLSPRLGWITTLNENNTIKVLYGEAFRAASLNETAGPNSPVIKGDPDLKQEVIKTYDLIYMHIDSYFNLQVGAYLNEYSDPISIVLDNENIRQYVNGASAHSQGVEIEGNWNIFEGSWLRFTFSELIDTPDNFFRESKRTGSLMFNYSKHSFSWNIAAVYSGDKKTEAVVGQFETVNAFWDVSSKFNYKINQYWSNQLLIKNLLNQDNVSSTQEQGLAQGISARSREVIYSLKYQW